MSITTACGHHCGSSNGYEGHCNCGECHAGMAPVFTRAGTVSVIRHVPMCDKWYQRSGGRRHWELS